MTTVTFRADDRTEQDLAFLQQAWGTGRTDVIRRAPEPGEPGSADGSSLMEMLCGAAPVFGQLGAAGVRVILRL